MALGGAGPRRHPRPSEQAAVLSASSLTLARGRRIVLRDVELALCRGEIVHLEVDALLRELLGAGWHVEEVRR